MPLLDVSEILGDPDFADTGLTAVTYADAVDADGILSRAPTETIFSGVVTADAGVNLLRTPDGQRLEGSILIHTVYRLFEGDEVRWQGRLYTVRTVNDYTRYGAGFVQVYCDLKPVN